MGFTLVELLVVISIIGILATLILLQLGGARARARDTQRISHINQLVNAMELYFEDNNGTYTTDINDLGTYFSGGQVPKDPLTQQPYGLGTVDSLGLGSPDGYQFYAELEQKANALNNDSDIDGTSWSGGVDGSLEDCTGAPNDCIYDRGQTP